MIVHVKMDIMKTLKDFINVDHVINHVKHVRDLKLVLHVKLLLIEIIVLLIVLVKKDSTKITMLSV